MVTITWLDYVGYIAILLLVLDFIRLLRNWYIKISGVLFIPRHKIKPQLIGLSISHYVEKVRWTLDLLEIDYIEINRYAVLGLLLYGETLPILKLDSRTIIGDSVDIIHYLAGKYGATTSSSSSSNKINLSISSSLSEQDRELLKSFDTKLGVHLRRYLYGRLLQDNPKVVAKLWSNGNFSSKLEKLLCPILFPISKFLLIRMLQITPKTIEESKIIMDQILQQVDNRLEEKKEKKKKKKNCISDDNKRQYLADDNDDNINNNKLSILDITFCSLVAPLLAEPLYGRGNILPTLQELGPNLHKELLPYQSRPFAIYVHQTYSDMRLLPSTSTSSNQKKEKRIKKN